MIQLSPSVRALIVKLYAERGRWCRTAELIYFGHGRKVTGVTLPSAPGAYPEDLRVACERARAEFLARRVA